MEDHKTSIIFNHNLSEINHFEMEYIDSKTILRSLLYCTNPKINDGLPRSEGFLYYSG